MRDGYSGARASRAHRSAARTSTDGWFSRGYLPHFEAEGIVQAGTFRLADSLPSHLEPSPSLASDDRTQEFERLLDAGHGSCILRRPDVAGIVEGALHHFAGERYDLLAWVIMPNHVHALIRTREGHTLGSIVRSWKSFTSKQIGPRLGTNGRLWQPEYHDRFIRDEDHLVTVQSYIENNPVKAGLVNDAAEWPFGSAAQRAGGTPALRNNTDVAHPAPRSG